jgi:hypothetical protein
MCKATKRKKQASCAIKRFREKLLTKKNEKQPKKKPVYVLFKGWVSAHTSFLAIHRNSSRHSLLVDLNVSSFMMLLLLVVVVVDVRDDRWQWWFSSDHDQFLQLVVVASNIVEQDYHGVVQQQELLPRSYQEDVIVVSNVRSSIFSLRLCVKNSFHQIPFDPWAINWSGAAGICSSSSLVRRQRQTHCYVLFLVIITIPPLAPIDWPLSDTVASSPGQMRQSISSTITIAGPGSGTCDRQFKWTPKVLHIRCSAKDQ